jgi:thymidylate synthase (FAD)
MQVEVVEQTTNPEKIVCTAARGDYYGGYVGETPFTELMESVSYDESDSSRAFSNNHISESVSTEARMISFIEKQLSRGHYGPWEHPQITFTVKNVSRSLMAQITRHRHLTFDVQSQRYVDFSDTEAITPESLLNPDHFSREDGIVDIDTERQKELREKYKAMTDSQFEFYEELVDAGIPKEDARFVLPIGTPVNITMSGNARTMMHVLNLRQKASSQWEIRDLSNRIAEELQEWIPYTGHWWEEHGPLKNSP